MTELVLTTFDWVPDVARGYVRDLRVRWALEEAGLSYRVEGVPLQGRSAAHFARQPFGQVPWLTDGDLSMFETGAILLYVAERSERLLPAEPRGRTEVIQWLFAALNSVEMASMPWFILQFYALKDDTAAWQKLVEFLNSRLGHMETVLEGREWLATSFSVADIAMADVFRIIDRFGGLAAYPNCRNYLARAAARPAFTKALADHLAYFAAADLRRSV